MSEKRQRKQQRRQRRQASGARPRSSQRHALDELARMTTDAVVEVTDGFEAELWASNLIATWLREAPPGEPVEWRCSVGSCKP